MTKCCAAGGGTGATLRALLPLLPALMGLALSTPSSSRLHSAGLSESLAHQGPSAPPPRPFIPSDRASGAGLKGARVGRHLVRARTAAHRQPASFWVQEARAPQTRVVVAG